MALSCTSQSKGVLRRSTNCFSCRADNYKEEVADDFAYEEQNDNYMMYRSKSGEVSDVRVVQLPMQRSRLVE